MSIRLRIFLGFCLAIIAGFLALSLWITEDIRLQPLKSTEEAMVDTANILAAGLEDRLREERPDIMDLRAAMDRALRRKLDARLYQLEKRAVTTRVYVTDARGIVIYDSHGGIDEGKDYSRWNDVYLTLRGRYGARATRGDAKDFYSTVLYVAAPVHAGGRLAGVLTVAKPVNSVKVFITEITRRIALAAVISFLAAAVLSFVVSTWITRPLDRLAGYAQSVRDGRRAGLPPLGSSEIRTLGQAFEQMRDALEGKQYVEQYVQTLTHEIKAPLSSIRGAAELLQEEPPPEARRRFAATTADAGTRIQRLVDRLLDLTALESRKGLVQVESVNLGELVDDVAAAVDTQLRAKGIALSLSLAPNLTVPGERFLLRSALVNLIQNAIDFTPVGGAIQVAAAAETGLAVISVHDSGPGIPAYALDRVFERFYSLPRPDTGAKSTGLGLALVREAVALHGGSVELANHPSGGTLATLRLPLAPPAR
ncbi:MAG: two-component system sensor histidine kinase CreC [Acidobacteria bacterium]|nr:two-component system sensor histidine kinase CreC [Acidobacteriota bacterium]